MRHLRPGLHLSLGRRYRTVECPLSVFSRPSAVGETFNARSWRYFAVLGYSSLSFLNRPGHSRFLSTQIQREGLTNDEPEPRR